MYDLFEVIAMTDSEKAKSGLTDGVSCVLVRGDVIRVSKKRGIAPMLGFIADGCDMRGFSAADRIVGKAAAMLFCKAGISEVYAEVLSSAGKEFLDAHGIPVTFGVLTDRILNRAGNGICPMEETVTGIEDVNEAYAALRRKYNELCGNAVLPDDYSSDAELSDVSK